MADPQGAGWTPFEANLRGGCLPQRRMGHTRDIDFAQSVRRIWRWIKCIQKAMIFIDFPRWMGISNVTCHNKHLVSCPFLHPIFHRWRCLLAGDSVLADLVSAIPKRLTRLGLAGASSHGMGWTQIWAEIPPDVLGHFAVAMAFLGVITQWSHAGSSLELKKREVTRDQRRLFWMLQSHRP